MADARPAVLGAVAVLLLAGIGWAAYSTDLLRTHPTPATPPGIATGRALVVRTDVRQQSTVTGALGYAGSYSVIAPGNPAATAGTATVTWLPAAGAVVYRGQPVYAVNGQPVVLFYGSQPAWRDLAPGVSGGRDVRQLNHNLAALGYGPGLAGDQFTLATELAVENWQQAAGLPVTGTVPLGQIVFLPGPLLVGQQVAAAGGPVPAGTPVVQGTSTIPDVQVPLDPNAAATVRAGNRVLVTLPNGAADPGVVTQVSRVAQNPASGSQSQNGPGGQQAPTVPATVRLLRPWHGALDQAQVQVAITFAVDRDVLAVPITALLARPGGQFAVVVVGGGPGRTTRRTVPVRTGLFDETAGDVEVSGPGLAAGQYVEVPS
ncbi:MAG TPA: peptidoglycan-binding domain-containing protein [Streptosporangiaceae bacterium]